MRRRSQSESVVEGRAFPADGYTPLWVTPGTIFELLCVEHLRKNNRCSTLSCTLPWFIRKCLKKTYNFDHAQKYSQIFSLF